MSPNFETPVAEVNVFKSRIGGAPVKRRARFYFILDVSGSMQHSGKIQTLNLAIRETVPHMVKLAAANPHLELFIKVLTFADYAQWQTPDWVPVSLFQWADVGADGYTSMGAALSMIAADLARLPEQERGYPPTLNLVSDGQPTDDFESGLSDLFGVPWGRKASRVAVAIGRDANIPLLERYINNPAIKPYLANNPESLVRKIILSSTTGLLNATAPASKPINPQPVPATPAAPVGGTNVPATASAIW
jgi:uncharacterized protein YegL